MTLPVIMITENLPTWEFALHPCLQSVTMLRKPYNMDKLLGMVDGVLLQTAGFQAELLPVQNWHSHASTNRARL